jgi:hypothetical protein
MIKIYVDEAYAFDYLSILYLKRDINEDAYKNWQNCFFNIEEQIGGSKTQEIINSIEYFNLLDANKLTFQAVEKARYGSITAKEVDNANMLRHKRKLELQTKFFYNKLMEYKT